MLTKTFTIQNPSGIHARPARLFVEKATSFPCEVNVVKGSKKINGKSIMGLMTLGAAKGDQITLEISGEQVEEAMEELGKLLESVHE
ncbi:phosphocarrier protein HPr [Brevibacillus agri]|uniref:HPr family phosphocarrier protein n=1 Tax=Brevibacillus agri TaxID=51101 RepID=A0A3M8BAN0_9BACL|nr:MULTISPECIES: HPr family phosphocarrier protein [Brevibacillus]ELK39595.1 phosphocarrier protein HPr [Brevibacillus agri BAB-2500]EJL43649.1 phosphotransferase system HPr (HPr) family protein [Brevibacillus sp. CF112]MBG9565244.1 PTS sugar transporter subunit IIA [Brevibacillus agri]MBY0053711.1 HPr family phosphocarrier protein [Brevibacillus agri]MCG5253223.1 HPr family phosphocarrier protein [Brevibacillus agri]